MPIPNKFHFFWGKSTVLPYARYLTMATCRIHHPDAPMYFYTCKCGDTEKWGAIFQDFQFNFDELNKCILAGKTCFTEEQREIIQDILLPHGDPSPWDRIKYDSDKIINIFSKYTNDATLISDLTELVKQREEREAKRPAKHDYIQDAVERLGVELKEYKPEDSRVYTLPPPNVSDIFSVEILKREGGWYLDLDQVVMKSLEQLGRHYDFLCGGQTAFYIGIFGSKAGGKVVTDFYEKMLNGYDPENYNSTGITAITKHCVLNNDWHKWLKTGPEVCHIGTQEMFYPLCAWDGANRFWNGTYNIEANKESYCCHYFGGNALSQLWIRTLTPQNLFEGNHCMGKYLSKYRGYSKELCLNG